MPGAPGAREKERKLRGREEALENAKGRREEGEIRAGLRRSFMRSLGQGGCGVEDMEWNRDCGVC